MVDGGLEFLCVGLSYRDRNAVYVDSSGHLCVCEYMYVCVYECIQIK